MERPELPSEKQSAYRRLSIQLPPSTGDSFTKRGRIAAHEWSYSSDESEIGLDSVCRFAGLQPVVAEVVHEFLIVVGRHVEQREQFLVTAVGAGEALVKDGAVWRGSIRGP